MNRRTSSILKRQETLSTNEGSNGITEGHAKSPRRVSFASQTTVRYVNVSYGDDSCASSSTGSNTSSTSVASHTMVSCADHSASNECGTTSECLTVADGELDGLCNQNNNMEETFGPAPERTIIFPDAGVGMLDDSVSSNESWRAEYGAVEGKYFAQQASAVNKTIMYSHVDEAECQMELTCNLTQYSEPLNYGRGLHGQTKHTLPCMSLENKCGLNRKPSFSEDGVNESVEDEVFIEGNSDSERQLVGNQTIIFDSNEDVMNITQNVTLLTQSFNPLPEGLTDTCDIPVSKPKSFEDLIKFVRKKQLSKPCDKNLVNKHSISGLSDSPLLCGEGLKSGPRLEKGSNNSQKVSQVLHKTEENITSEESVDMVISYDEASCKTARAALLDITSHRVLGKPISCIEPVSIQKNALSSLQPLPIQPHINVQNLKQQFYFENKVISPRNKENFPGPVLIVDEQKLGTFELTRIADTRQIQVRSRLQDHPTRSEDIACSENTCIEMTKGLSEPIPCDTYLKKYSFLDKAELISDTQVPLSTVPMFLRSLNIQPSTEYSFDQISNEDSMEITEGLSKTVQICSQGGSENPVWNSGWSKWENSQINLSDTKVSVDTIKYGASVECNRGQQSHENNMEMTQGLSKTIYCGNDDRNPMCITKEVDSTVSTVLPQNAASLDFCSKNVDDGSMKTKYFDDVNMETTQVWSKTLSVGGFQESFQVPNDMYALQQKKTADGLSKTIQICSQSGSKNPLWNSGLSKFENSNNDLIGTKVSVGTIKGSNSFSLTVENNGRQQSNERDMEMTKGLSRTIYCGNDDRNSMFITKGLDSTVSTVLPQNVASLDFCSKNVDGGSTKTKYFDDVNMETTEVWSNTLSVGGFQESFQVQNDMYSLQQEQTLGKSDALTEICFNKFENLQGKPKCFEKNDMDDNNFAQNNPLLDNLSVLIDTHNRSVREKLTRTHTHLPPYLNDDIDNVFENRSLKNTLLNNSTQSAVPKIISASKLDEIQTNIHLATVTTDSKKGMMETDSEMTSRAKGQELALPVETRQSAKSLVGTAVPEDHHSYHLASLDSNTFSDEGFGPVVKENMNDEDGSSQSTWNEYIRPKEKTTEKQDCVGTSEEGFSETLDSSDILANQEMPEMTEDFDFGKADEKLLHVNDCSSFMSDLNSVSKTENLCFNLSDLYEHLGILKQEPKPKKTVVLQSISSDNTQEKLTEKILLTSREDSLKQLVNELETVMKRCQKENSDRIAQLTKHPSEILASFHAGTALKNAPQMKVKAADMIHSCRVSAKARWKKHKADYLVKFMDSVQQGCQRLEKEVKDVMSETERVVQVKADSNKFLCELDDLSRKHAEVTDLQNKLEETERQNVQLREQHKEIFNRLTSLTHQNKDTAALLDNMEASQTGLEEQLTNIQGCLEWTNKTETSGGIQFEYLFGSLILDISLINTGDLCRRISNVTIKSRLGAESKPWAKLAHSWAVSRIDCHQLLRSYQEYSDLHQILHEVSCVICDARQLCTELRTAHRAHGMSVDGNRLKLSVTNRKRRHKVLLETTLSGGSAQQPLVWTATTLFGSVQCQDVEAAIARVQTGPGYISRVLTCVQQFLAQSHELRGQAMVT